MDDQKPNHILDYHRDVLEADQTIGRELLKLNEAHIEKELGLPKGELAKKTMPTKAVRKLKRGKKRNKKTKK